MALSKSPSLWTDTKKGQPGASRNDERTDSNRQLSLEEIFELLDLDGDGELTKEEVNDCCWCDGRGCFAPVYLGGGGF